MSGYDGTESMKNAHLHTSVSFSNTILSAYQAGHWLVVSFLTLSLCHYIAAAGHPQSSGSTNALPWLMQAQKEVAAIEDKRARLTTFVGLASAFAQHGEFAASDAAFLSAKALAVEPNGFPEMFQYPRMLAAMPKARALARAGQVKEALIVAENLTGVSQVDRRRVVGMTAIGQAEAGDLKGALTTADSIEKTMRERVLGKMARVLAESGRVAEAHSVADANPGAYWKDHGLAHVAEAHARSGQLEKALATAAQIKSDSQQVTAYVGIAVARAETGDYAGAIRVWEQTVKPSTRSAILATVAQAPLKVDDLAAVKIALEQIQTVKQWPWLKPVIGVQIRLKDFTGAQATAQLLQAKTMDSSVYSDVVEALVSTGKVTEADAFIQTAVRPDLRPILERKLVRAILRSGVNQAVLERVKRLSPLPESIQDPVSANMVELEREIVQKLAAVGEAKTVQVIYDRLPDKIKRDDVEFEWQLATAQAKGGNYTTWDKLMSAHQKQIQQTTNTDQQLMLQARAFILFTKTAHWEEAQKLTTMFHDRQFLELLFGYMHVKSSTDLAFLADLANHVPLPPMVQGAVFGAIAPNLLQAGRQKELSAWMARLPTPQQRAIAFISAASSIGPQATSSEEF
ncbi:MAG: hypothetical protein HZA89_18405 [Verrucomicrobia bacterium]|nr:hypothetical protein [Verrucomicrobiota bacterium]